MLARIRENLGAYLIVGLSVLLLLIGLVLFRIVQPAQPAVIEASSSAAQPQPEPTPISPNPTIARLIKVYVSGAVMKPDVYSLQPDARVKEALEAAGGAAPDADLNRINLALRLHDEMQVHVPRKGESISLSTPTTRNPTPSINNKLNINTASAAQLEMLPGIGEVTAAKIITHREQNGPFKSIEDLKSAKLVTNAVYERIKDLITVE